MAGEGLESTIHDCFERGAIRAYDRERGTLRIIRDPLSSGAAGALNAMVEHGVTGYPDVRVTRGGTPDEPDRNHIFTITGLPAEVIDRLIEESLQYLVDQQALHFRHLPESRRDDMISHSTLVIQPEYVETAEAEFLLRGYANISTYDRNHLAEGAVPNSNVLFIYDLNPQVRDAVIEQLWEQLETAIHHLVEHGAYFTPDSKGRVLQISGEAMQMPEAAYALAVCASLTAEARERVVYGGEAIESERLYLGNLREDVRDRVVRQVTENAWIALVEAGALERNFRGTPHTFSIHPDFLEVGEGVSLRSAIPRGSKHSLYLDVEEEWFQQLNEMWEQQVERLLRQLIDDGGVSIAERDIAASWPGGELTGNSTLQIAPEFLDNPVAQALIYMVPNGWKGTAQGQLFIEDLAPDRRDAIIETIQQGLAAADALTELDAVPESAREV